MNFCPKNVATDELIYITLLKGNTMGTVNQGERKHKDYQQNIKITSTFISYRNVLLHYLKIVIINKHTSYIRLNFLLAIH
jgi:hypothetical protein